MVDTTMEDGAVGCGPVKASYDKVVRADVFKAVRSSKVSNPIGTDWS